jgi:putative beta-barrel porin BBP2
MTFSLHWPVSRGPRVACARLLCALAMLMATGVAVRAQAPGVPGRQVFYSNIGPLEQAIGRYQTDPRPKTSEGAFQVADWLLYGGLGWGLACDYNLNSSPTNQQRACGPQITPSIVAAHNTGIQRTLVYAVGDIRWYPALHEVQVVDTSAGLVHVWEIQRDLIFRIQGEGMRNQGYSSFAANLAPSGQFVTSPVKYNQGYGSASLQKEFGSFFTAIGGSVTRTSYDNIQDNLGNTIDEQLRNGTVSTANARVGYYISPIIYTYIEPTLNWQRYADPNLNSQGYRVVAGLGSGRLSLFNGEIYAGYAGQRFDDPNVGTSTMPVVGGRLSWFPTRFLTYTLTADRAFGTTDFLVNGLGTTPVSGTTPTSTGSGLLPGAVTTTTTATLSGVWDFSRLLSFNGSIGDQRIDYLDSSRRDNLLSFVAGVLFKIRPGLGIQVNYTHQNLFSNFPGAPFKRDFISAGAQSRF